MSEGSYDFEVRAHSQQADAPSGSNSANGPTVRVARRLQGTDTNGQGTGWEFSDAKSNWYKQSELKGGTNPGAANDTHIPIKK